MPTLLFLYCPDSIPNEKTTFWGTHEYLEQYFVTLFQPLCSPNQRLEETSLAIVWMRWALNDKFLSVFPLNLSNCSYQLNSEILRAQFGNQMTLNNPKMVAETRSYIPRWCSWFWCWRPYLSFLKSSSLSSRMNVIKSMLNDYRYEE